MTGYVIREFKFDPGAALKVITRAMHPSPVGQTGHWLKNVVELRAILADVTATVSQWFERPMYMRLDKSSYRRQFPDGTGALPLHQDYMPLQDVMISRFHFDGGLKKFLVGLREGLPYLTDPCREPACTVWLPIFGIDQDTPTLEIAEAASPAFIPHKTDPAGYAVLADEEPYRNIPLRRLTILPQGDGALFGPLTLHRSCVLPHHTRVRHSMDLRFLSRPMP